MRNVFTLFLLTGILLSVKGRAGGNLPDTGIYFIENKGQITDKHGNIRGDIQFKLVAPGLQVFIGKGRLHYQFSHAAGDQHSTGHMDVSADSLLTTYTYRMDMMLEGINADARVIPTERQPYFEQHFLTGNKGPVKAGTFRKIIYRNIYRGIDWVLYIKDNKLKYDFVVNPGANVSAIRFKYGGATDLVLNTNGSLTAFTPMGKLTEQAPYSYRAADGKKVSSSFILKNGSIGFKTGKYSGQMIIDPTLEWGTYYGGIGSDDIYDGATDKDGNIYAAGFTRSPDNIATTGSHQDTLTLPRRRNAFLVKFNSDGVRQWATYYGSTSVYMVATKCDQEGNVYLAGSCADDAGIATPGAHQTVRGGSTDAFLAKFTSSGTRLWATYYGGISGDAALSLSCDAENNVYMGGATSSTGMATPGAHNELFGGVYDAFLVKFNSNGVRQWATYCGAAAQFTYGNNIAVDVAGNVYLGGYTSSTEGIATTGSYQETLGGGMDAFLVKFNSNGVRQWGTYFGGPDDDFSGTTGAIACDSSGYVYLAGSAGSTTGISSPGAHQVTGGGSSAPDGFLVKFDGSNGQREWSTYYGGGGRQGCYAAACNLAGDVYIVGNANYETPAGTFIATPGSHQETYGGGNTDGFVAKFNSAGVRQWGTYYGGTQADPVQFIACDKSGNFYFGGTTSSGEAVATSGGHQTTYGGGTDGYVVKMNDCTVPDPVITLSGPASFCEGDSVTLKAPGVGAALSWQWQRNEVDIPGATDSVYTVKTAGRYTLVLSAFYGHCSDISDPVVVTINPGPSPVITETDATLGTTETYTAYQWQFEGADIPGATGPAYSYLQGGNYTVVVENAAGCTAVSPVYVVAGSGDIGDAELVPNPARDFTEIRFRELVKDVNVTVITMEGKKVITASFKNTRRARLNVRSLAAGVYQLRLTNSKGNKRILTLIKGN